MATIDDIGGLTDPLSAPPLGGPSGWAAAVRDAITELQGLQTKPDPDRPGQFQTWDGQKWVRSPIRTTSSSPLTSGVSQWVDLRAAAVYDGPGQTAGYRLILRSKSPLTGVRGTMAFAGTYATASTNVPNSCPFRVTAFYDSTVPADPWSRLQSQQAHVFTDPPADFGSSVTFGLDSQGRACVVFGTGTMSFPSMSVDIRGGYQMRPVALDWEIVYANPTTEGLTATQVVPFYAPAPMRLLAPAADSPAPLPEH